MGRTATTLIEKTINALVEEFGKPNTNIFPEFLHRTDRVALIKLHQNENSFVFLKITEKPVQVATVFKELTEAVSPIYTDSLEETFYTRGNGTFNIEKIMEVAKRYVQDARQVEEKLKRVIEYGQETLARVVDRLIETADFVPVPGMRVINQSYGSAEGYSVVFDESFHDKATSRVYSREEVDTLLSLLRPILRKGNNHVD